MLRDASIVVLSSIDWSFNRQNPQEVALSFAGGGNRVLFVENTGVRRAALRDAGRLWSRLRNWWRARGGPRRVEGGVDLLSPLLLPLPYTRAAVSANARVLSRAVRRWHGEGGGPLVVITYLPTPLALEVIGALRPALTVYYCVDLLAESSPGARRVEASERRLLAEADLVFATSAVLYERAAGVSSRVELLESGVCVEKFERAREGRAGTHDAFEGLTRPVVGYVGSLRDATDLALLERAAGLAPDLQFVLAGPSFVDVTTLANRPNVRVLGAIGHESVAPYMVRFDVGVLPYLLNKFTAGIMPVKLKEYLAAGLPVVATPLPEVRRFAEQHPGLVRFAGDPEGFVAALRAALPERTPELLARRLAVARRYDWGFQMARMSEVVEQALARAVNDGDAARH